MHRQLYLFDVPLVPCLSVSSSKGQIRRQKTFDYAVNPFSGDSVFLGFKTFPAYNFPLIR